MALWARAGNIGDRLCEVRLALGMTQAEFGALMGVTDQSVSDYETGRSAPGKSRLQRLANDLQLPVAVFSEGGPMPSTVAPIRLAAARSQGEAPPGAPETLERLEALQKRLRLFKLQLQGYKEGEAVPSPAVIAAWLDLLADLEDAKNSNHNGNGL